MEKEKEKEEEVKEKQEEEQKEEQEKQEVEEETVEVKVESGPVLEELRNLTEQLKIISQRLQENVPPAKPKSIVQNKADPHVERRAKILEALHNMVNKPGSKIAEQWEVPVAQVGKVTAHLRRWALVSEQIRGKPGDTVNIPYAKDFDLTVLGSVGGSLTETSNLVGSVQTTLKEAGFHTTIGYHLVEKLGERVVSRLEEKFANAALRAEDKVVLDTLLADTNVPELDKTSATSFDADYIVDAINKLISSGKTFEPGTCVLVLDAKFYADLVKDIAASQPLMFANPELIERGLITNLFGVDIAIAHYLPEHDTGKHSAYLIMREAFAIAPKRNMLLETEKDTKERKIKITGTHTFGVAIIDNQAAVEIKMGA